MRHELDGRGARRRGHHGIDVACLVAAILRAIPNVDLMVDIRLNLELLRLPKMHDAVFV